MTKFAKRFMWLNVCVLGVLLLLARELIVGHLSPRGFGIAGLILMVAVFFVLKQFVLRKDLIEQAKGISPGASVDEATRKRIKRAKVEIAILAILLLNGLRYIGSLPLWPLLVGVAVNLLMIAYEVQVVRRLKKSLP